VIWELFDIPNEMPFEFTKTTVPVEFAVWVPAARTLPPSPAPPPAGTEIRTLPFVTPTEAIPAPAKINEERALVPEVLWVVFEVAYIVAAETPPVMLRTSIRVPAESYISGPESFPIPEGWF